jgi:hypothetical protein
VGVFRYNPALAETGNIFPISASNALNPGAATRRNFQTTAKELEQ